MSTPTSPSAPGFARRLTLFDATMIVISGMIGSGIFINPYVVAQKVETPFLILAVWIAGGVIALFGRSCSRSSEEQKLGLLGEVA